MRDMLLFAVLLGGIPLYFTRPFYGMLAYHFVSIMNPHRLTWGAAFNFPFATCIATATLLGIAFIRQEKQPFPNVREVFLFFFLWFIYLISTLLSLVPELSWYELKRTSISLFMVFITMKLCNERDRILYVFAVIAISIGLLGIKGGIFSIMTGGGYRVSGPELTFITDNNDFGLALNMTLPFIYYFYEQIKNTKYKFILMGVFFLNVLATILTYSRGAYAALIVLMVVFIILSKNKLRNMIVFVAISLVVGSFISDKWTDRMSTIDNAKSDSSFMGRVNAWESAYKMALDHPLTGGGLGATQSKELFARYAPDPANFHAAHSIYFQMLGENGFIGLGCFMALLLSLQLRLNAVRIKFCRVVSAEWLSDFALTVQLSLMVFMVNGITLGRAYFDLVYLIMALGIMIISLANRQQVHPSGEICVE